MDFLFACSALLSASAVFFLGRRFAVQRQFDLVDLTFYYFAVVFVLRPLMLVLGLDEPWLSDFMSPHETLTTVAISLFVVVGWMVLFTLFVRAGYNLPGKPWLAHARYDFRSSDYLTASIALLVLAAAITVPLVISYGGAGAFTTASKVGREDSVAAWGRIPSLIGSVMAASGIILVIRRRKRRQTTSLDRKTLPLLILVFLLCGYLSFLYGSRDALVLGFLAILLGPLSDISLSRKVFARAAVIAAIVLTAAVLVRQIRDVTVMAESAAFIREESIVRQVSLAANLAYFDSLILALRDYPNPFTFLGSLPFVEGLRALPGMELLFGQDDETFDNVAREVLRNYYPWRLNGNPITAVGDWYVSFGLVGLIAGSAIGGLSIGWLQKLTRSFEIQPVVFVTSVFVASRYMPFGISAHSVNMLLRFVLPIMVTVAMLSYMKSLRRPRGGRPNASRRSVRQ